MKRVTLTLVLVAMAFVLGTVLVPSAHAQDGCGGCSIPTPCTSMCNQANGMQCYQGLCYNLLQDPNNCSSIGHVCAADAGCINGQCIACDPTLSEECTGTPGDHPPEQNTTRPPGAYLVKLKPLSWRRLN